MNYGKAFKEIREERGFSRPAVASKIGCTPSALSKIENGRTTPKEKTISRFCAVAQVPVAYFYQKALSMEDYWSIGRP